FDVGQQLSTNHRVGGGHLVGEVVATAGLIALIFALARTKRGLLAAPAVGAYIGAAYWFTSSTSFANPAVTVGRAFTDTFAGIAPASVPGFVAAQLAGAALVTGLRAAPSAGRASGPGPAARPVPARRARRGRGRRPAPRRARQRREHAM